jgi:pyruvate/2-oxoglutarate dehydrogenase complex dihydrolipoamide acyltransferase (E2) component
MKIRVKVPKVGLTVEEVKLLSWEKSEGETVTFEETIAVVEGDKASFEVVAPSAGILTKQIATVGDLLPVGSEIAIIET